MKGQINIITTKVPAAFFAEIDKLILKSIWKSKGPRITKQSSKTTEELHLISNSITNLQSAILA
jgi:hypothetical protein